MLRKFYSLMKKGGIRLASQRAFRAVRNRIDNVLLLNKKLTESGVTKEKRKPQLIVSLTSFPARMATVHGCITSLLSQSLKPDMVVLWLAESQFPARENELPAKLLALQAYGLTIKWCADIKSYKKLIPTLREYPDDIIVTADDDLYYHRSWLERLYQSYLKQPRHIHCHRITKIYFDGGEARAIAGGRDHYGEPSFLHKLTGGSGALYPPNCFHEDISNSDLFMKLAPTNDDQWFWLMAALKGTKVSVVENMIVDLKYVHKTQKGPSLTHINDRGERQFFIQLENILRHYPRLREILTEEHERQRRRAIR